MGAVNAVFGDGRVRFQTQERVPQAFAGFHKDWTNLDGIGTGAIMYMWQP